MKVKLYFKWFDLWVGAYVDTKAQAIYIQLIPMIGIKIWKPLDFAPFDFSSGTSASIKD